MDELVIKTTLITIYENALEFYLRQFSSIIVLISLLVNVSCELGQIITRKKITRLG